MTIRAIIFDRDGVLSDFDYRQAQTHFARLLPLSVEQLAARWIAWGGEVGFPSTKAEETEFFQQFWRKLSVEFNLSDDHYQRLVATDYMQFLTPYRDARPALDEVKRRGLRVGVLSNFSLATLEESLDALQLLPMVDASCAATALGHPKPEAEAYLTICRQLDISPTECLYFDDEPDCVAGAAQTGMVAYLVDRYQRFPEWTNLVVQDLSSIKSVVDAYE